MAEVFRLPCLRASNAAAARTVPAPVINIGRRDSFDLAAVRDQATVYAALPNVRDVEAAVRFFMRDYRKWVRRLHDIAGEELKGAEIAVEATLRKEINRIRKDRKWPRL
ncbi:hypothetical protein NKI39_09025 [Mesorhizobium sp. M0664]|uniref:hypothetical protein n=1 Tax=Mesorhizobium sp. M0664 TaxID=2956982 RepID=UPI003335D1C1